MQSNRDSLSFFVGSICGFLMGFIICVPLSYYICYRAVKYKTDEIKNVITNADMGGYSRVSGEWSIDKDAPEVIQAIGRVMENE